ncbi:MAG: hypothetical protein V4596_10005 [Bdellovibrionota bacterium]
MKNQTKRSEKRSEIKKVPEDQKKMIKASKDSQGVRNQHHFDESEAQRVKGFSKSIGRKAQVQRDA